MNDREAAGVRRIRVAGVPTSGERIAFEMGEDERMALASSLGIPSVERYAVDLTATPWRRNGLALRGRIHAEVVQESVVTLEPVRQSIAEAVDLTFIPEASSRKSVEAELELDPEGEDLPDVFSGDSVDLSAALQEVLALALDPYPREATASFAPADDAPEPVDEKPSPFAALAQLKSGGTES